MISGLAARVRAPNSIPPDMSKSFPIGRSLEDEATYVKWRRGIFIFYTGVGLVAAGVISAAHFAGLPIQFAGN
jgi:hypothetical protein